MLSGVQSRVQVIVPVCGYFLVLVVYHWIKVKLGRFTTGAVRRFAVRRFDQICSVAVENVLVKELVLVVKWSPVDQALVDSPAQLLPPRSPM